MKITQTILLVLVLIISTVSSVDGVTVRLDQKKGTLQSEADKKVHFKNYSRLEIDFTLVPLKYVMKILMIENKIFILDNKRSELYVIDRTGKHLYTVGRPGQGPGDIEYGWDFTISNNKIYVLNSMPKRISVFSIDGTPVDTIRLEDRGKMTSPTSIAVDKNQNIIIGSAFDDIINLYDPKGKALKTLLPRSGMISYKDAPSNIGIPSSMQLQGNVLYHLDIFKGVITSLDLSGKQIAVFNAYNPAHAENCQGFIDDCKNDTGKVVVTYWSHLCTDESGRLYAYLKSPKEGESKKLIVYSKDGEFLYSIPLDFFQPMMIRHFSIYKGSFLFFTKELDFYIAN